MMGFGRRRRLLVIRMATRAADARDTGRLGRCDLGAMNPRFDGVSGHPESGHTLSVHGCYRSL